jgi:hypothetical protein
LAKPRKPSTFFLTFAVIVELFALASIPLLLPQSGKLRTDFSFTKPLVGSLYAGVCILGISAVFYPKKCERSFMFRNPSESGKNVNEAILSVRPRFEGHHPDCQEFSANRIKIQETTLCSACTGLVVGATAAIAGTLLYFFIGYDFVSADSILLLFGYAGLLLGLIQSKLAGYFKLMANAAFVLGSFVTLITVDLLGESLLMDLFVLFLIVFSLLTRILISEWNNKSICRNCGRCK